MAFNWTQRSRADIGVSGVTGATISVADAQALVKANYSAVTDVSCVIEVMTGILALKGITGDLVQQNSGASLGSGLTTFAITFPGNVTAGDTIIVALTCSPNAFGTCPVTVTDSLGNTYTEVYNHIFTGGTMQLGIWMAVSGSTGANTVTATSPGGGGPFSNEFGSPAMSILEYPGSASVDVLSVATSATGGSIPVSVATAGNGELLLNITGMSPFCSPTSPTLTGPSGGFPVPPGWLVINEPATGSPPTGGGYTDRTNYLYLGEGQQNNYTVQLRQRGQATIHLRIRNGDTYMPTRGSQVYLFDQVGTSYTLNFAGIIQNLEVQSISDEGDQFIIVNAVSFESVLDTVLVTIPMQFFQMTCGEIVTSLFNTFEVGAPITLGVIDAGATIELLNTNFNTIADLLDQLATASGYIWGVDVSTLQLYFRPPFVKPAPFTLTTHSLREIGFGPQFGSVNWKQVGNDYRNRQAIRISPDAFAHSTNYFVGSGQINFTLSFPVSQVVNAWVTKNTCNFSTGTFTGQPSPGDTLTIQYPIGIPQTTWHANTMYPADGTGIIIDPNNFVQLVVVSTGTHKSGATQPAWNDVTGGFTTDGGLTWKCLGPQGLGTNTAFTYTFVAVLDNTQFGQILIGATLADTVQNTQYALMAVVGDGLTYGAGISFSLPTWENGIVNTVVLSGTQIKCTSKSPGQSQGKCLFSWTGTALSFNPIIANGGSTTFGTINLAVGARGTNVTAPGLYYQPGSADVSLATPLNPGSNLQVEYTRAGGDTIQVENTTLVRELATISHGTGKYQAIVDYSQSLVNVTAADALKYAQQIIAAYSIVPERVTFDTYQTGLAAGQALQISLTRPTGATGLVNGLWVIEEIDAQIEPCALEGLCPGIGHYKSTVTCIDIQQIASFIDFWQGVGGGTSIAGSGSGSALVSTGGGSTAAPTNPVELQVNGTDITDQSLLNLSAGSGVSITDLGGGEVQITATGGSSGISIAWDETPSGTINGSNTAFTLANDPTPPASLQLFYNGVLQIQGTDYTLAGNAITFTTAPLTGSTLVAFYRYGATTGTFVDDEIPTGTINGSNVTFNLANSPNPVSSLRLFYNGVLQIQGTDYTISGATITFTTAPLTGSELVAYYVFAPSATNFADDETPSGSINGSNVTFGLAHTPNPSASLQLYLNGVIQLFGTDFTLIGATITMTTAPLSGATLRAFYRY